MANHLPSDCGYKVFVIMVSSKEIKRLKKCKLSLHLPPTRELYEWTFMNVVSFPATSHFK